MSEKLVTAKQAAAMLGVCPKTVYRLKALGILRTAEGTNRIIRSSIDEWLAAPAVGKRIAAMISKYGVEGAEKRVV